MKIVADENISLLEEYFASHGRVVTVPGRSMQPHHVRDADVLLVRSVTKVDANLLRGSSIKFVGSCTIGTDHLDTSWLGQQGIRWAHAPGCNADAVVDYVLACCYALGLDPAQFGHIGFTVGVVGCGNVGSRLVKRLEKLGATVLCCDPFKRAKKYLPLEILLRQSDLVCLHTPLTRNGKFPTLRMINQSYLGLLKPDAILLNAGRGEVIDEAALLHHLENHRRSRVVLDVWQDEPAINRSLLQRTALSTPHIAGYSIEGKQRGTAMIYQAFCEHFGLQPATVKNLILGDDTLTFDATHFASLQELVLACYDPRRDDEELRHAPQAFDQLRKLYLYRREFASCRILHATREQKQKLKALGFKRY